MANIDPSNPPNEFPDIVGAQPENPVLASFRPHTDLVSDPFGLPTGLEWDNFSNAWTSADIGRYTLNSVIILAGSLTALTVATRQSAAHARLSLGLDRRPRLG